ncbi:replication protein A 70 kDa DNA-binding subunit B [Tanacetum coccineum]
MLETARMALVNQFKDRLKEGSVVTLERYSLEEIQSRYRYKSITDLKQEDDGQFDVIRHVVACEDLDNYAKNGKSDKKKPLTLVDDVGNELKCTLWSAFAQQFNDFLNTCSDHEKIIVVLQLAMMKIWDDSLLIASYYNQLWKNMKIRHHGYHATKLFFFDGTQPIVKEEFQVVKEYSLRLFAREDVEKSENTSSRISTASKNSTKEGFVTKIPPRNIVELLNVTQGVTFIIVGTIITIHEEKGWWYIGCRSCRKKPIRSQDMIDLEADMPKKVLLVKMIGGAQSAMSFQALKLRELRFMSIRHDETGTMSLTLWNDEVQDVVNRLAYQLCDKYGKGEQNDQFPTETTALIVFTVLCLSNDPKILDSICVSATPSKMDSETTSSVLRTITPLDLESQMDENTTTVNTKKIMRWMKWTKRSLRMGRINILLKMTIAMSL